MSQSEWPEGTILEITEVLGADTILRYVAYREGDEWSITGDEWYRNWEQLNLYREEWSFTVVRFGYS